jgi:hypothetical protein
MRSGGQATTPGKDGSAERIPGYGNADDVTFIFIPQEQLSTQ